MGTFSTKISGTFLRLRHAVKWWPLRVRRIGRHLIRFCWSSPDWWLETLYLLLDMLCVPEIYETLADWLKWNSRPLNPQERALLLPLFGDSIEYDRIRIDERAFIGPPQWKICYVSFCTVNSWGPMHEALLIHEVVHVWQFQRLGSVYIPRALKAQMSQAGYNYGGAPRVANLARMGATLHDFNLEQQADLIADYWRLTHGRTPGWGPAGPADVPFFAYFAEQLTQESV